MQDYIKYLKGDASLCYGRKANPMSDKSTITYIYHVDVQARLMDFLQSNGSKRVIENNV